MENFTTTLTIDSTGSLINGQVKFEDTLTIINAEGDEVENIFVESSEDEAPYREALEDEGYTITGVDAFGEWTLTK